MRVDGGKPPRKGTEATVERTTHERDGHLGDATRRFLQERLAAAEAKRDSSPIGSVARAEAAQEAREISGILDQERLAVATRARD